VAAVAQFARVLVTGGAGFVGSHLVEQLLVTGGEVTVLDDLSRGNRDWIKDAELVVADIRDRERVAEIVRELSPDLVVHLAALHFIPAVDDAPELAHEINVEGTQSVIDALGAYGPRRVVFASTAAVYPLHEGPIPETVDPGPIDIYGRTKLEGERIVSDFAARSGTDVVAARLFNVIGRRETNPHVVPEIIAQVAAGAESLRLGSLEPQRDYIDAVDVASALVHLAREAPAGMTVFNVGNGEGIAVADLVDACGELLGRPLRVEQDPARIRRVDRPQLIADATLLRATGWKPSCTLGGTLHALLAEAGVTPASDTTSSLSNSGDR
jgi:UDP-glucose 4-epimerase